MTFRLEQNYPNPFNPTANITYSVPNAGFVSLKVYDILGCDVATLVDEIKQPGKYLIIWDASGFTVGVYICRLQTEGFTGIKKLVLLK